MDPKERALFNAIMIAGVIIGVIIIYFIISIIRQQRRNQALYRSKIEAEITTTEKERTRIASDLHDELGPLLSSVKMRINSLDITGKEDTEQVEKVNTHLDDIISRMREISNDLMPATLLRKGLIIAMEEFIGNITPGKLKIYFSYLDIPGLSKEKAINLYRILQEVIHNTIKHAGATSLKIDLKAKNGLLIVSSEDNGEGFNYQTLIKEKAGLGLRNILSRTEMMKGEMFIETKPGKGTCYIFEIPI